MKTKIYMLSIIVISILFTSCKKHSVCDCTKNVVTQQHYTEKFMQQAGNNSMNWLELTYHKDSVRGIFHGFEKASDGRPIYYKSIMEELELTDKNIKFVLRNYSLGYKPFVDGGAWEELIIKDESTLPALLKFSQNFSGVKSSSDLKLKRTSILYDSKFDELTLIKVNR
jgi:hypothetical protein